MYVFKVGKKAEFFMAALLCCSVCELTAQDTMAPPVPSEGTAKKSAYITPRYDVASIRQNLSPHPSWRMNFTGDGVIGKDVTLFYAIQEAYGFYDDERWSGVPLWATEKRFDIEAKYDVEKYPHVTLEQRNTMLQQLLAERLKLNVHLEQKEFPVYTLRIAKGGPKFTETKTEDQLVSSTRGPMCQVLKAKTGLIQLQGCSMQELAGHLTGYARSDFGRTIVDRTGLAGRYSLTLNWTPDAGSSTGAPDSTGGPSISTATEEQLGLTLKPDRALLDVMVIDHVEMPSEN